MVEFDVETDEAFLRSLNDLGADIADAVLDNLFHVAAAMTWHEFCAAYNWREHQRDPMDTYPGAVPYYRFDVTLPDGMRQTLVAIFSLTYDEGLVLCAVAQ